MREWKVAQSELLFSHRIMDLERRSTTDGEDRREAIVLRAPDWVNVIPLLDDGQVVMIRQWRHGIQAPTLEVPGGMVDPGEDARAAAARELEEETGYTAGRLERLGSSHPNPAFIANRLTTWLARDLKEIDPPPQRLGVGNEEIQRTTIPLDEIPRLVQRGEISHALVIVAFHLLSLERR